MIYPLMTNGFSHCYHLGGSTLIFRGFRSDFHILFIFSMKFLQANRIAPDETPRSAASHLGLFCLRMYHKKDARLKCVNRCLSKRPLSSYPKLNIL